MWRHAYLSGVFFLITYGLHFCGALDVTTVYRNIDVEASEPPGNASKIATAECHARTNALGLPFVTPDGSLIDPNVGVELPSCHYPNCSWSHKNWQMWGNVERFGLPPLNLPQEVYKFSTDGSSLSEYIPVAHISMTFAVRTATKGVIRVLLLTHPDVETSDLYLIELVHNELFKVHLSSVLFKCGMGPKYKQSVPVVPNTKLHRSCYAIGNQHLLWTKEQELKFRMNIGGNRIEVFRAGQYSPLVTEVDDAKLDINFIAFLTEDIKRNWIVTLEPRSFVLEKSGGVLSSPMFVPYLNKICLSFYSFIDRELSSKISVTARLAGGFLQEIGVIEHNEMKRAWQYQRMVLNLLKEEGKTGQSVQIFIHGETIYHPSTIALHGLKGCNPFDEEDIALVKVPAHHTFICNMGQREKAVEQLKFVKKCPTCLHGGVCNNATGTCICPPGFIGFRCQDGCGRNSFGADCRGSCSGHAIGCWGMTLCTQGLGCNCAPGFTGKVCNVSCPHGRYGINCSESCAMCEEGSSCDMYTGVCYQGCMRGFNPPLCTTPIRYLNRAPNVSAVDVHTVRISFTTRPDELAGEGTPMFYHVQYRGRNESKWVSVPPQQITENAATAPVTHIVKHLTPGKSYAARVLLYNEDGDSYTNSSTIPVTIFETGCEIPTSPVYNLKAVWNQKHGFSMEWKYNSMNKMACEVEYFKVYVKEGWRRYMYGSTKESQITISGRSPDSKYMVEVEAVTNHGPAPLSDAVEVATAQGAPSAVMKLHYRRIVPTELEVQWQRPKITGGHINHYVIKYQCLRYLACPEGTSCSTSAGTVTSQTTDVHLTGLLPFAQYEVQVAGFTIEEGPYVKIVAATLHTDPEVAPASAPVPLTLRSTRTLTFEWLPVEDCRLLHGYPIGYQYSLIANVGSEKAVVFTGNVTEPRMSFEELVPRTDYEMRVMQIVTGGQSNNKHQLVIWAQTRGVVSTAVRGLHVSDMGHGRTHLEWSPPLNSEKVEIHHYIINHKCVQYLACPPQVTCNNTGTVTTPDLFVTLTDLPPYATIEIEVAAFTGEVGKFTTTTINTSTATPRTSPEPSKTAILGRGATWVAVEWLRPTNCTLMNGPLVGYSYRLTRVEDKKLTNVIAHGSTAIEVQTTNFTNLTPHTQFVAGISAVVSTHNYTSRPLNYKFWTRFAAPGAVEELTVYKQDFTSLGLKWTAPEYNTGLIDSFAVHYSPGDNTKMTIIRMSRCLIWEQYFCHELTGLQPNIDYNVTVQVWNSDNEELGEPATISATTTQIAPDPPSNLKVTNRNTTSAVVSWEFPVKTSGKVTSFYIRYHQYESFRMWECCDNPQTIELPVNDELTTFTFELVGLKVASMYVVQVSTVTTNFTSTPVKVEINTLPGSPMLEDTDLHVVPGTITNTTVNIVFKQAKNKDGGPISVYFIVLTTPDAVNNSQTVLAPRVKPEMTKMIGDTRYICMELLGIEVEGRLTVKLGTGGVMYGVYGRFVNHPLVPGTRYGLRLVVLAEYEDDRSYSFIDGEYFTTLA